MERSAFSRAWDYVGYAVGAKWAAMACAALSGASYIALVLVLGLFADLIVSGGRIPTFAELSEPQRAEFRRDWNGLSQAERLDALAAIPDRIGSDADQKLIAADIGPTHHPDDYAAVVRWRAYVGHILQKRAGLFAAQSYRARTISNTSAPAGTDPDHIRLGLLSLVVRNRWHPVGYVAGWIAHVNAWTFHPAPGGFANRPYLTGLVLIALAIAVARLFFNSGMHRWAASATIDAITRLRRMIYHHSNRLGSLTISEEGTAEAVGLFSRHVESVHDGLYARLTVAVREPIKFVMLLIVALAVNVPLGLSVVCAALLVWLLARQTAAFYRRGGRQSARRASNQLTLLQESIRIMRLVKGYLMGPFNQARVERQLGEYAKAQLRRFRGESIHRPLVIFLGTVAAAALLFLAGWLILSGVLNVAGLVLIAVAIASMWYPLDVWLAQRRLIQRSADSAAAIFEFLDRHGEVGQVVGAEFLKAMSNDMVFDQVTLREPGTQRVLLDNLNMKVPAGERVAVVSADDAATHALVSLVPRFLDPTAGEIRIDGKNIRWVTLDSLRNQVSLVMQQSYTFNDTAANNIGCGDPSYSIPQIIEAAKTVHAHNFLQKLPYGYETPIGELGFGLRVGERFRIALARAVLRDPAVLVIEEPDEVMDEGARAMVDDAYERILPGRTVIFLPRRLATVKACDRVYLIHGGQVAGEGEHRELLQGNELYRHLHYLEYNMFSGRE